MKILLLTYRVPYPPVSGERLRTFQIISLLLAAGHEVFLATFISIKSEIVAVDELRNLGVHVTCVPLNPLMARLIAGFKLLAGSNLPIQSLLYSSSRMRNSIAQLVSANNIDVLYIFLARMGQYYSQGLNCFQVLDFMDAFSVYYLSRSALGSPWSISRMLDRLEGRRLKVWESALVERFPLTTAITEHDSHYISLSNPPLVIPTHVGDCLSYRPTSNPLLSEHSVIFFGEMSTFYSESAVLFAFEQVMPLVWLRFPEAVLYVVGSRPTSKIAGLACKRVVVTGFVEDIRPYVSSADVAIVPLFMGSGLKNKIIQSMALRVPVVSTTIANEGIDGKPEEHILIADDAILFAESIIRLLESPSLRRRIVSEAYHFVSERYSDKAVSARLSAVLGAA